MKSELGRKIRQSINIVADDKSNYEHKPAPTYIAQTLTFWLAGETPISKAIAKAATNKMETKIKIVMWHTLPIMVLL